MTIRIEDVEDDIDDDTVLRFLEYAYKGDYCVPLPTVVDVPQDTSFATDVPITTENLNEPFATVEPSAVLPIIEEPEHRSPPENFWRAESAHEVPVSQVATGDDLWDWGPSRKKKSKKKKEIVREPGPLDLGKAGVNRYRRWDDFSVKESDPEPMRGWWPPSRNSKCDDCTSILLCHAKMYKFSERYAVPDLSTLSLRKLRKFLQDYVWYEERVSAVVELVRYAYHHTMDYEGSVDKLRKLVLEYAVCYVKELVKEPQFKELLQEGGPLASELMVQIVDMVD